MEIIDDLAHLENNGNETKHYYHEDKINKAEAALVRQLWGGRKTVGFLKSIKNV
jgi:hypothetical protein